MKKMTITLAVLATLFAGCASVGMSKNPNRIQNPEKDAYAACMKKNNGDKSKCAAERQQYLERQEMEIMDNNG
jgi:uncharacterized protein YceK